MFRRELVALEAPAVIGEVFLQGLEAFPVQAAGQLAHDPPGEHFRVEGPGAGQIGQDGAEELLDEVVGEGETDVGADPEASGHLQGEPPLHAAALDQDDLRDRGRGQRLSQDLRKLPGEGLEAVAGEEFQTGHDPLFYLDPTEKLKRYVSGRGKTMWHGIKKPPVWGAPGVRATVFT